MSGGAPALRRLAYVAAPGPAADAAAAWLSSLSNGGTWTGADFADVPLARIDVLWAAAAIEPRGDLLAWLEAGGRLLATGGGSMLPTHLGLEPESPAPLPDVPLRLGLAGFGPHPLFAGLHDGAAPTVEQLGSRALALHLRAIGGRPAGAVVAVASVDLAIQPDRALAWEYRVGRGGILCLGIEPSLRTEHLVDRCDAAILLTNALVGDAVPHADRSTAAPAWPTAGAVATMVSAEVPALRPSVDPWPPSTSPAFELAPVARWTLAGRRMLVTSCSDGTRELWAPPFRAMHHARVIGARPCAPARIGADEFAGGLALAGVRLAERWTVAADVPAAVWEIAGPPGVEISLQWEVDLRRAWPYPDGAWGDLVASQSDISGPIQVAANAGPRAVFAASAGTRLWAEPVPGAASTRLRCEGVTPLQVACAAGIDTAELGRALAVLQRDGAARLAAGRALRAAQLGRFGTALELPDDALVHAFDWARERGDEALIGAPGVGRSALVAAGDQVPSWCFGSGACWPAAAQLVAGNREPAREVLRFLAQRRHPSGGIRAILPLGGLAGPPEEGATEAFLWLVNRYAAWTADRETIQRLREPVVEALRFLARGDAPCAVLDAEMIAALDELVGGLPTAVSTKLRPPPDTVAPEPDPYAVLETAAAALRRAPGALPVGGAGTALLDAVRALWGLEPDAFADALALRPTLSPAWTRLAIRRLRVGRTTLDLELRVGRGAAVLRVHHLHGPRLVLTASLHGAPISGVEVDDVPLAAERARFESRDRHEVRFHLL